MKALNNVHVTAPHGSPLSYEVVGGRAGRTSSSSALSASAWAATDPTPQLPVTLGSLDAAEMHDNLGMPAEPLAARTDRALALIESALAPQVGATLRAVA